MKAQFNIEEIVEGIFSMSCYLKGTEKELIEAAETNVIGELTYMSLTGNKIPDIEELMNDKKN